MTSPQPQPPSDPFDSLLTLEDTLYTTAYSLGVAAGSRSGRIEGRLFGLEQGFEKFATLGELHGRSVVWGSRIPGPRDAGSDAEIVASKAEDEDVKPDPDQPQPKGVDKSTKATSAAVEQVEKKKDSPLPGLKSPSSRLTSHIHLLHALTDPPTFSTSNTEDAVADYDDRVRRAGAKAKVIERIVGEFTSTSTNTPASTSSSGAKSPEAAVRIKDGKEKMKNKGKGDENMEDFAGSRLVRGG